MYGALDKFFLLDEFKRALYYNVLNGLPSNHINDMFYDGDTTLFLATSNGLCAFDVYSHESRVYTNLHGISHNNILTVFKKGQSIFVTNIDGLWLFNSSSEKFQQINIPDLEDVLSRMAYCDINKKLYIASTSGLYVLSGFNPERPESFTSKYYPVDSIVYWVATYRTECYIATKNGCFKLESEKLAPLEEFKDKKVTTLSVIGDRLIISRDTDFFSYDGKKVSLLKSPSKIGMFGIYYVWNDQNILPGSCWFVTNLPWVGQAYKKSFGAFRLTFDKEGNESWQRIEHKRISREYDQGTTVLSCVAFDGYSVWIGTPGEGLVELRELKREAKIKSSPAKAVEKPAVMAERKISTPAIPQKIVPERLPQAVKPDRIGGLNLKKSISITRISTDTKPLSVTRSDDGTIVITQERKVYVLGGSNELSLLNIPAIPNDDIFKDALKFNNLLYLLTSLNNLYVINTDMKKIIHKFKFKNDVGGLKIYNDSVFLNGDTTLYNIDRENRFKLHEFTSRIGNFYPFNKKMIISTGSGIYSFGIDDEEPEQLLPIITDPPYEVTSHEGKIVFYNKELMIYLENFRKRDFLTEIFSIQSADYALIALLKGAIQFIFPGNESRALVTRNGKMVLYDSASNEVLKKFSEEESLPLEKKPDFILFDPGRKKLVLSYRNLIYVMEI